MAQSIKQTLTLCILLLVSFSVSAQLKDYRWTLLETQGEPKGRHENTFVEYKDKLYLLGGRGINPVNVFDPQANTWETKGKSPMEIHHFQGIVYEDKIYLMGAMTGRYPKELPLENIWIYAPETDTWEKGPQIPEPRRRGGAGAVLYKEKIYLVGGIKYGHTSGTTNLFDAFDPKTGTWEVLTDAPHIRDHFPAIEVNNKLYCIGGRNTSVHYPNNFGAFFNATIPQVDCYDFETQQWVTLKENLPIPTAAGGLVHIGNSLLYMGGEGSLLQAYNHTQCLNLETCKWSQLAPLEIGRHGSAAVVHNNKVYLAAGSQNKGGGNMSSIECFSLDHPWTSLFDGKTLNGWTVQCTEKDKEHTFWQVENGAIVCNSLTSNNHNYVWLQSDEEYADFELRLKFQVSRKNKGNSGVQIRSRYNAKVKEEKDLLGWLDGVQVDIDAKSPFRTGLLYDETRNTKRWIHPSKPSWNITKDDAKHKVRFYYEDQQTGWNNLLITCKGSRLKTMVNNVVVSDEDVSEVLNDKTHQKLGVSKKGHVALQLHKGDQNLMRFKEIEVREL